MVNWHRMSWFGAVWGESYGFLRRGVLELFLVTVILFIWFVYLKIIRSKSLYIRPTQLSASWCRASLSGQFGMESTGCPKRVD